MGRNPQARHPNPPSRPRRVARPRQRTCRCPPRCPTATPHCRTATSRPKGQTFPGPLKVSVTNNLTEGQGFLVVLMLGQLSERPWGGGGPTLVATLYYWTAACYPPDRTGPGLRMVSSLYMWWKKLTFACHAYLALRKTEDEEHGQKVLLSS